MEGAQHNWLVVYRALLSVARDSLFADSVPADLASTLTFLARKRSTPSVMVDTSVSLDANQLKASIKEVTNLIHLTSRKHPGKITETHDLAYKILLNKRKLRDFVSHTMLLLTPQYPYAGTVSIAGAPAPALAKRPTSKSRRLSVVKTKLTKAKDDLKYAQARKLQGFTPRVRSSMDPNVIQKRIRTHTNRLKQVQKTKDKPTVATAALDMDLWAAIQYADKKGKAVRAVFSDGERMLIDAEAARKVMSLLDAVSDGTYDSVIAFMCKSRINYMKIQRRALFG